MPKKFSPEVEKALKQIAKRCDNIAVILEQQGGDLHEKMRELVDFIKLCDQNLKNYLSEHLHDLAVGFGKEDFIASTKLGPGTGIILHGALSQGTEGGNLNYDRESELNVKIETAVNNVLDDIRREHDPSMNPFITNLNPKS